MRNFLRVWFRLTGLASSDNCLLVDCRWFSRQFAPVRNVNRPQKILTRAFSRRENCENKNAETKLKKKTWLGFEAQIA
jgi:hypothetical protein